MVFSIEDKGASLTDSADPKQYIKQMKSRGPQLRFNRGTNRTQVEICTYDKTYAIFRKPSLPIAKDETVGSTDASNR